MSTETLFRLRIPLQLVLLAFAVLLGWMMTRRSD
jgi:hypothetical protein